MPHLTSQRQGTRLEEKLDIYRATSNRYLQWYADQAEHSPHRRCLSTAGARPNPRWLAPLLNQGCEVYCGFDADPAGDDMARAMIALHPTVKRLRPPEHDWNDVLRAQA